MSRSGLPMVITAVAFLTACSPEEGVRESELTAVSPSATFFLNDAQGTPIALADASGAIIEQRSHHALGTSRNAEPTGDAHDFMGNELDTAIGISDFNARPYRTDTGTFLSPDPVAVFEPEKTIGDPRRVHAYAYSAGDPVNLRDSNGEFFDVVVDVASIGYDLYSIVADNIVGSEDNLGTNLTALGADVVGAVVPFATGGGAAVRAATHGDEAVKVSRTIFVGGTKALPRLTKGSGREMFREAVGHLKSTNPSERLDAFRQFADDIRDATKGAWSAKPVPARNGSVFAGEGGEALAFDASGNMYRGLLGDTNAFVRGRDLKIEIRFENLKAIK